MTVLQPLGTVIEESEEVVQINLCGDEVGLFVEGSIHGSPASMLVDTGATVSLIAKGYFDKIFGENYPLQAANPGRPTYAQLIMEG